MPRHVCATCGAHFPASATPPASCPICEDVRQWVPASGQAWTSTEQLATTHANAIRDEGELVGVGIEPHFAIGQRALLVPCGDRLVLWDCVPLLDEAVAEKIEARGGLAAIAISHPHYHSAMVDWADRFSCPIRLHAADARWITQPGSAVELWDGDTLALGDGLTLIRCGGHFAGGTVLHWAAGADGAGALLTGDVVQLTPRSDHVSFMYSYPNLIPLSAASVRRIGEALEPFAFDRLYGAWWSRIVPSDGRAIVFASVERYLRALRGELDADA